MGSARLGRLERELDEQDATALLVLARSSRDPDLAAFTGPVHLGLSFLIAPRGGPVRLGFVTPMERAEAAATGLALLEPAALEVERRLDEGLPPALFLAALVAKGLKLCDLSPGRLALAGHGAAGVVQGACARLSAAGWTLVPGNDIALALRKTKTAQELAGIRAAAAGACAAFRRVARLLAGAGVRQGELWLGGERLRVARLRAEVAVALAEHGLEQPEGNILAPGEEGAVPHSTGTEERVLRPGESLVIDLFPRGRLYADCTRTFCVGEPPEPLARAHAAVAEALARAHREARPGVRGWDLQEAACARLGLLGYPTPISDPGTTVGYVHGLGHGVGFDLHETPSFRKRAGAEGVLAAGDVFTLEPGLYDPEGGWGVRLEDLVHLGPDGPETLTPLPYELVPGAWK